MFEISFGELLVIFVIALVVLGPERLPKVARTLGAMMGRLQRYVADVKMDLAREQGAADGFRTIVNTGRVAHQEVQHVHVHVIGGPDPLGPMIVRKTR